MKEKTALITGAAGGIGTGVANALASRGVRIALCDLNETVGERLAAELECEFIPCDVSRLESFEAAVDACIQRLGVPDYVHLNAGVMTVPADTPFKGIEEVTADEFNRIIGVNLAGVYHGFKVLLPHMRGGEGAITVTSSTTGVTSLPFDPLYSATKYAVIGLARSIAAAGDKPRVNVICPGGVDTAIVPEALRAQGLQGMSPSVLAEEVVDLLERGANGEVRVKNEAEKPAFVVEQVDLNN